MKVNRLVEAPTSRIYQHITSGEPFAMISAYRSENDRNSNRKLQQQLKSDVRNLGLGFIEFESK